MELRAETVDGRAAAVLAVSGEIDLLTAPELHREITRLTTETSPYLIVDLSGVAFLDSTALGVLVAGRHRAEQAGGTLSLVCRQLRLLALLRTTALDEVFDVHPGLDQALATLPVSSAAG